MTTPEPDQVAEVLARVAGEHQHQWVIFKDWPQSGCTCGARDRAVVDVNSSEISAAEHRAHLAAAQAAALRASGLVVEGTEVEEWGVQKRAYPLGEACRLYGDDEARARWAAGLVIGSGAYPIRRTRTRYPDRVTEWVAVDEGGE